MSLISLSRRAPIPFEADRAQETAGLFPGAPDNIRRLLGGVAGCSPYLRGLIRSQKDWLETVLDADPNDVMAGLTQPADVTGFEALGRALRVAKKRMALYVALADCGGMWTLDDVTGALTMFADSAVKSALDFLVNAEIERARLPGFGPDDRQDACGLFVLAMGKMGAFELNYSSDIDLIVLFDDSRIAPANFDTIRERFIRITRRLSKLLSEVTADGYVFRTDLRLRPDPSVTPVALSVSAAERYYESVGRTWERAAFIKARPCAGDIVAGENFLKLLRPFVWRKHLDFAAIQDAHDMRLRIREHKSLGGPIVVPGHDLKLGRGGIREIEFFTQTRQIIAGGRDRDLQKARTQEALASLTKKKWAGTDTTGALSRALIRLRTLEHRVQMLADAQTHLFPKNPDQIARLAAFCDEADTQVFIAETKALLEMVHALTESFFAPGHATVATPEGLSENTRGIIEKWHLLPAFRSDRARLIFDRLKPAILSRIAKTANPDQTLARFDGFLAGLPAGVQLFSLFQANPHLIDLLVDICGSAPDLAGYLSHNAQVFDGVIGGTFFEPLPDCPALAKDLTQVLSGFDDYEDQLNAARRWKKEQHFRIGVQHLKGMVTGQQAALHYSDLAEGVLRAVLPRVIAAFAVRHGALPGRGAVVLGMGSLGARSLTAASDLDLIVIYDAQGHEVSDGRRPLAFSTYFARLTQSLVTALSSPMAEGRLYEVDMRLRPSGRKGPVATALSGFVHYQRNEAWTWEHLALTRARVIGGNPDLAQEVERERQKVLNVTRKTSKVRADVADMRLRLADAADRALVSGLWEAKQGPGRMLDIELLGQTAALLSASTKRSTADQLGCALELGWLTPGELTSVLQSYRRLSGVQQVTRLLVRRGLRPENLGADGLNLLLAETGAPTARILGENLAREQETIARLIDRCLRV